MPMDKQTAEALVAQHGGVVAAARAIGVQHAVISRAIRGRTDVGRSARNASMSPNVRYLRERIAQLETQCNRAHASTGEAMEIMHALRSTIAVCEPPKMVYRREDLSTSPCTHVAHVTDWHFGATVDADEVDGFGKFNPEIALQRVERFTGSLIRETELQRHGRRVPSMRIIGTGDYISGDIHEELKVSNAYPAPRQAVACGYTLGSMLVEMSPHFETVVADLVTLDNHGRMTKKPQATQGGVNNWGYVVAEIAKQYASRCPNVEVRIHAKPTALVSVGPERYLAFHGHQIKGWAGKPYYGFDRRVAMEAVKRMGVPESAFTKLLLGHFHHAMNGDCWLLGGSLSGTDAFDHSCGRHSKPHQTSWFVHPTHGEFGWTRWWL